MNAYYNEYDPKAAAWLRGLIKAGRIAPGFVDERSITEVDPEYVKLFTQAHFFAGIGGWSYALRLAGWADNRPVWTGSPPCQPFSNAGKQKAQADARHLWPVFFNLIRECKPANIFGEQVEAAIRTGWLDDLQDDLETEGYATGKIVLPACSVGGYHIRQRIWFVAERVADTTSDRCQRQGQRWPPEEGREPQPGTDRQLSAGFERSGDNGGLAFSDSARCEQGQRNNQTARHGYTVAAEGCNDRPQSTNASDSIWGTPDWLFCRDGKWRPVESGTFPLANGIPERMVRLRGYGNAIVPQVAAEVIKAYMEAGYEL
jgi:DNA (cytosine-5)-methyltransferase 1